MLDAIHLVLKRHWKLAVGIFVFSLLVIVSAYLFCERVYEASASFYVQRQVSNQYDEQKHDDLLDHIRILKSDLVLQPVLEVLKHKFPKRHDIDHKLLIKRLRADSSVSASETGPSTKVVDLSFQDTDPRFAKAALKATLHYYERGLEYIAKETRLKEADYLKKKLISIQKQRLEYENKLRDLETLSGTTDIELKNAELVKLKSAFSQTLATLNADLAANNHEMNQLKRLLGVGPESVKKIAGLKNDTKIEHWQEQLAAEKAELVKLESIYTNNHPFVREKEDAIKQLEKMIQTRLNQYYGKQFESNAAAISDMDISLGKELIDRSVRQSALLQQKNYYETYLAGLSNGAGEISLQKMDMGNIRFNLETLKEEEGNLRKKLQDVTLEQANLQNLGSFVILTPVTLPGEDNIVFPMNPKLTLVLAIPASLMLALFAVAMAEFIDPQIILFETPSVTIGELKTDTSYNREKLYAQILQICQGMLFLLKAKRSSMLTVLDLFDSSHSDYDIPVFSETKTRKQSDVDFWRCGEYVQAIASGFAQKNKRVLLVECTAIFPIEGTLFNPFRNKTPIADFGEIRLYRSNTQENLFLLSGLDNQEVLDPDLIDHIHAIIQYELLLVHRVISHEKINQLQRTQTSISLLQASHHSVVLGLSKSKSHVRMLQSIQQVCPVENILGSVIFS